MMNIADSTQETTSGTSTSVVVVNGATAGNRTFIAGLTVGMTAIPLRVEDDAGNWLTGEFTLSNSTTLTRTAIGASSAAGGDVTLAGSVRKVSCVPTAAVFNSLATSYSPPISQYDRAGGLLGYNGTPSTSNIVSNLTPANVSTTGTSIEQTVTISGLQAGDIITGITAGGAQPTNVTLVGWRIISAAAGTVGLMFKNTSGSTATPYAGNYTFAVARMTGGVGLPHITLTGTGASTAAATVTTLTGSVQSVAINSNKIRHCGRLTDWETNQANYAGFFGPNTSTKTTGGNAGQCGPVMRFDVETDANKLEMTVNGTKWRFQVIVDGKIVTPAPMFLPDNYKAYRVLFDFTQGGAVTPANTTRRIRIEAVSPSNILVGGLTVSALDSVWAPASESSVRAIMFGDSGTEGYLLPFEFTGFANQVGYAMGWDDLWISAVGGTGYLKKVPGTTLTWRERITDITTNAPDVVVILGSLNDTIGFLYTAAQVQVEATLFYQQLTAALPNALIFVAGVQLMQPSRSTAATLNQLATDQNNAIKAAVQNMPNVYFIDMVAEGWFTGSGTSVAPVGDGNADRYVMTDNTHMTQAGHDYMARRLMTAIRATGK